MGTKIKDLPFGQTLDGTEVFEAVQGTDNVQVSAQQLVALAGGAANAADAISVLDEGGYYTGVTAEAVLQEVGAKLGTAAPNAAAGVTIADAGGLFAGANVEDALQETATATAAVRTDLAAADIGKGAALVRWLRNATGAVARWLSDKLAERISVEDFGAVGDGVADDTAAFLAARDYAASIGGADIHLGKPKYKLTGTIRVTKPNIKFRGRGGWINHDVGTPVPGTWIDWAGPSGGTMFEFIPVEGASNQRGTNGGLVDVALFGNNIADNGLVVKSWTNGEFRVYGANFNRTIVEGGVVGTLGEARDCQFNDFWIFGRQITSPVATSTLIIGGDNNGSTIANTSFNKFHQISTNYKDGVALDLYDSDSNWFGLVRLNSGGGTGKGMVWHGGTNAVGPNPHAARGNYFSMVSVGAGGFEAKGTPEYVEASSGAIAWYDMGNAAPVPVVGTGALVAWSDGGFVNMGPQAFAKIALGGSRADAIATRDAMTTETLRLHNASSNHAVLTDGTNTWGINLSGGDLRFTRVSGTGAVRFGTWTANADAAVNGYITMKDIDGTVRKIATIA